MLTRGRMAAAALLAIAAGVVLALVVSSSATGGGGAFVTVLRGDLRTMTIHGTLGANEPDVLRQGTNVAVSPAYNDTLDTCEASGSTVMCPITGQDAVKTVTGYLAEDDDLILIGRKLGNLVFRVTGGSGEDQLKGGQGSETLRGGPGADTIRGRGGDDRIDGNGGNDALNGGPGRDRCRQGPGRGPVRRCELPRN